MRQIILDTETTGLEWKKGNRIVEIGCVELFKRRPTGNNYHQYIKPDCEFEQGAQEVTGLTLEFLDDKPEFAQIADEFLAFIDGAELIIHNAAFDLGFLDNELSLLGPQYGKIADRCTVIDTLAMARERFPASATRWMRCASGWAWTTRTVRCMAACSMRRSWAMSISH